MQKIDVMGISFDNVTMAEAVEYAFDFIKSGNQAFVVTPNAEIMELCIKNEEFRKILLSAQIILPDGEGVLWAAKKLSSPLKEKVAGVDFGAECLSAAAQRGKSVFLLGGKEGVAEKAAIMLKKRFPALCVAGTHDGYFARTGEENATVISQINESGAELLFVCLGSPAQEKWVYENRNSLQTPKLIACLGGSIDIYAGEAKRAPEAFIKLRAEWLYRLLREPKRIGRMMSLPKFMISVYKYKKNIKKKRNTK